MAKKRRKAAPEEQRAAADYYKLNTKAIDDLVTADPSNSPKVSEAELRKYRSGPKIRLSDWVKVVLVKWWFAGAVCFFFYWGLGMLVPNMENMLLILGIGLGMITNLLTNNVLRFWAQTPGKNDRWVVVTRRGAPGLFLCILYGYAVLGGVVVTYNGINAAILAMTGGAADSVPLGVEPILFGLFATGWDFLLLALKRTGQSILADAKAAGKTKA